MTAGYGVTVRDPITTLRSGIFAAGSSGVTGLWVPVVKSGHSLKAMYERFEEVGGWLKVQAAPGSAP